MQIFRYGDTGPQIDLFQSTLKKLGFYHGKIDGIFGKETENAVKEFQRQYGLQVDGIIGEKTLDKLFPYINGYTLYRIEPNDTFYSIAQKFGTDVNFLLTANFEKDPNNLKIGSVIVVPFGTVVPTDIRYTSAILASDVAALSAIYPFLETGTIGKSILGVDIPYIKIGRGQKEVLYVGSLHGSDWITSVLLMKFTEDYCKSLVTRKPIGNYAPFEIYDNATIYIVPIVNPDGVDISTGFINSSNEIYTGIQDAANRQPQIPFPAGWNANIRGVDLDLQFPANWEEAKKINYANGFNAPTSSNFPGYAPLTEPESIALYNFTLSRNFSQILSYHTSGEVIYWKYNNVIPEGSEHIANMFSEVSGYTLANTPPAYAYGSFKDWFIQDFYRPGFVIKPGKGNSPIPLEQFPTIYGQNIGILIYGALL